MVGSLLEVVGGVNWLYLGSTWGAHYRLVRDGTSHRYLDCTLLAGTQFDIKRAHALILQPLDEQSNRNEWGERIVHSLYNYYVLSKRYLTKVEVPQIHKSRIMCRSRKEKHQTPKFLISNVPLPSDVNLISSSLISFISRGLRLSLIILES